MPTLKLSKAKSIPGNYTDVAMYSFAIGNTSYRNLSTDDAFRKLVLHANLLSGNINAAVQWHTELMNIYLWKYAFGGGLGFDIWDKVLKAYALVNKHLDKDHIRTLIIDINQATECYNAAYQKVNDFYSNGDRQLAKAIEILTYTKTAAIILLSAYNPYLGTLYEGELELVQQEVEVAYNMRDEVDILGIGIDVAVGEIFNLLCAGITDAWFKQTAAPEFLARYTEAEKGVLKLFLQNPSQLALKKLETVVITNLTDPYAAVLKAKMKQYFNGSKAMTWQEIYDSMLQTFSTKEMVKKIGTDLLSKP